MLILPLALVLALIFVHIDGAFQILTWLCKLVFHELGHALIFWLRSIIAVPSFGMTVPLHPSSSIFVFLAFAALALWGIRSSKRANLHFIYYALIFFLALLFCFSILVPARTGEMVMLYGGLGGELYLATLAMLAFYQPMPKRFDWRRNRYFFLVIGTVCFCGSALQWYRAKSDKKQLPMGGLFDFGGAFSDSGESSGDLDRLMREFGWSADSIITIYTVTTLVCVAVLIGYYFYLWYQDKVANREVDSSGQLGPNSSSTPARLQNGRDASESLKR